MIGREIYSPHIFLEQKDRHPISKRRQDYRLDYPTTPLPLPVRTTMYPRDLLTTLISSIRNESTPSPAIQTQQISNPLLNSPENIRKAILTLHVLFPHELLPALDLLDRNLITRLTLQTEYQDTRAAAFPRRAAEAYLVRSGQSPSHRGRADSSAVKAPTYYEVRLQAWTCSCPAFAFAAFPAMEKGPAATAGSLQAVQQQGRDGRGGEWRFGGLTVGSDVPVCKHLLACVLVEYSEVFAGVAEEREVSGEELAGWAAGWGD